MMRPQSVKVTVTKNGYILEEDNGIDLKVYTFERNDKNFDYSSSSPVDKKCDQRVAKQFIDSLGLTNVELFPQDQEELREGVTKHYGT